MIHRLSHRSLPTAAGAVLMFGLLCAAGGSAWPVGARLGIAGLAVAGAWILYREAVRADHTSVDDARRDTWDRYLRTLDHMLEGCQIIDTEWRYVYLNEAAARHGRRPREELVGRTMMEAYPGIESTAVFAAIRRALIDKTVSQLENEFTYPDGTTAWFELRIQPVPEGVFILSMDITDRKSAGTRLSESEERFRQMAENIRDVFWLTDPSKNEMLYVSPAYEEIWSQSRERLFASPRAWLDAIHPDDRARVVEAAQTKQTKGLYAEEYRIVRPDGSVRWIWDRAFPVVGKDGQVSRVAGVAEDITERKRTADALRESERRFRGMLSNLRLVSLMLDREARITYCNDYLLQLTGWAREEVLGRSWFDLFVPPATANIKEVFASLIADHPEAWHHENEIVTKGGERRLIRWNNSVLRSTTGEVVGTASVGEDVTGQKRLEEELRQSQKMEAVGRLAGGVAHDFNNILNVITGYTDMVLERSQGADRRKLEQINRAAERAAGLTRQLLAFSRKQVLDPKVLAPSVLLSDMHKMLERLIGEDVELKLGLTAEGRIKFDPGQLEQVIMNLVVNARDAMPTGGHLTVAATDVDLDVELEDRREVVPPGRYVVLSVADTGQGMDDATLARIFEPFFTTKPEGKGTGLGLATSYGIVRQSGGHIRVETTPGQGAVFSVYLPRVEEAAALETPREAAATRRGTETVLLVEDDDAARDLLSEVLREEGYTVLLATNGQEAVDTAAHMAGPIHLLLTDVILPKLSGRVVSERVRTIHPRVKVLYMSGYTDDAISRHGVLDPGIAFLQKPFRRDDLTRKVAEILQTPRTR